MKEINGTIKLCRNSDRNSQVTLVHTPSMFVRLLLLPIRILLLPVRIVLGIIGGIIRTVIGVVLFFALCMFALAYFGYIPGMEAQGFDAIIKLISGV